MFPSRLAALAMPRAEDADANGSHPVAAGPQPPWWMTLGTALGLAAAMACGSSDCTDGFVAVEDESDLRDLGGCTSVKGNVEIRSQTLTSLDGLEGLSVVEGRLWIRDNAVLTDLSAQVEKTCTCDGNTGSGTCG
jgi:hypothetical protein